MKSYLCIESEREVFQVSMGDEKERPSIYFVIKVKNMKEAKEKAKSLGAKVVRPLTKKELATEKMDGSYDIEL